MKKHIIAVLAIFAVSQSVLAEPTVLYDAGEEHTHAMDTYMRLFDKPARFQLPADARNQAALRQALAARAVMQSGSRRLPIRTPNMRPEKIDSRDAYFPNLIHPIFVIGADENSVRWLRTWRETLLKVGAIGWVVQAENDTELRALGEAGKGLRMLTMSGEQIPNVFGISTYPVLISSRSIEQ